MYCIARHCVLPPLSQEQRDVLLTKAALQSIADVLEAVPDPRSAHGLRYDLPFLLTCLVAALLCNCDGTEAVAQWCRDHPVLLQQVLGCGNDSIKFGPFDITCYIYRDSGQSRTGIRQVSGSRRSLPLH